MAMAVASQKHVRLFKDIVGVVLVKTTRKDGMENRALQEGEHGKARGGSNGW